MSINTINTMVANQATHVPAFLAKLWRILEDPSNNKYICWSEAGNSFIIHDTTGFARDTLPKFYKHNNMASFVRQLNMYGFHKVVSVEQGGLRVENNDMEFAHPYFLQGNEQSLDLIKRKIPASKLEETRSRPENLNKVLIDVRQMRGRQETMDAKLMNMKRENEALWRELSTLRQKHVKQQQIVSKLLQFLVSMMSSQSHRISFKRRMPLMLNDVDGEGKPPKISRPTTAVVTNDESSNGPVIHEVFEGDEPFILSIPDEARNEQPPRVVAQAARTPQKGVSKAPGTTAGKKAGAAGTTGSAGGNQIPETSGALEYMSMSANANANTGSPQFNNAEFSADSPYISELLSINSMDSAASTPESPGVQVEAVKSPGVPNSTDMVPVVENEQMNRQPVASRKAVKPEVRDDLDFHLDDVQLGLDNLKDLLQGTQYNIDSGTLSGVGVPFNFNSLDSHTVSKLFDSQDNIFSLVNENNEKVEDDARPVGNDLSGVGSEMVSYNPCLFELAEDDSHFFEDVAGNAFLDAELESMMTTDRNSLNGASGTI